LPFRPRPDTWLQVLGGPDNMAGTSIVDVGGGHYIVAAGFTPGSKNDIGLLLVGSDGPIMSQRYTSNRDHSRGMGSEFYKGAALFVKALSLGGNKGQPGLR
jgi:hypothetical protein